MNEVIFIQKQWRHFMNWPWKLNIPRFKDLLEACLIGWKTRRVLAYMETMKETKEATEILKTFLELKSKGDWGMLYKQLKRQVPLKKKTFVGRFTKMMKRAAWIRKEEGWASRKKIRPPTSWGWGKEMKLHVIHRKVDYSNSWERFGRRRDKNSKGIKSITVYTNQLQSKSNRKRAGFMSKQNTIDSIDSASVNMKDTVSAISSPPRSNLNSPELKTWLKQQQQQTKENLNGDDKFIQKLHEIENLYANLKSNKRGKREAEVKFWVSSFTLRH